MFGQHPFRDPAGVLPAELLVPSPGRPRRGAKVRVGSFLLARLAAMLTPWIQNVPGDGRVIAYAPVERRQRIEAPTKGRVIAWHVNEGQRVREGEVLLDLVDNDPQLLDRLGEQRAALEVRLASYETRVEALTNRLEATDRAAQAKVRAARAKVRAAQAKVESADQKLLAAEANLETALLQLSRQRALAERGLVSSRDRELAELSEARARTSRESARAEQTAAQSDLLTARADLGAAEADAESKVASAQASLESARTDVASTQASLASLGVSIARTESQRVVAPRDGTVLRYLAGQGGEQVKEGDPLLEFIPDDNEPAVELWVDGNDAALIRAGAMARLQFEGWPAVQFAGWPAVAVGTFGGRVAFVDSADDGRGNFRVVVLPDPDDEPWPSVRWLRQGVRTKGWFLLNEVSLGYEVWRQLNGFPPRVDPPGPEPAGSGYGGYGTSGYGYTGGSEGGDK